MSGLTIVNFAHPLTDAQLREIIRHTGREIARMLDIPSQFDVEMSFKEQANALVAGVPLDPAQWQTEPLLVNLPSLAPIAAVVLAIISGRKGGLPSIVRLKPVREGGVTEYAVAEIIDLDDLRNTIAREARYPAE